MDSSVLSDPEAILDHLRNIQFIGKFPGGYDILLVSFDASYREAKTIAKDLKESEFKKLLKTKNILVFNSVDDWVKFRNAGKEKK